MMLYCIKFYKINVIVVVTAFGICIGLILILERSMKKFFIHLIVKLKLLINQMM